MVTPGFMNRFHNLISLFNPNYYFVIYHFNGLKANTTKRDFLDGLEMWMTPPAETENKTPIALLLLAPEASSSMNFLIVQAVGKGTVSKVNSSVSEGTQKYFRRSHMIPITDISALLRGLESDSKIFFCWKCADHFTKQHAFEEHQKRGCNNNDFKPGIEISEEDIIFHKWNKLVRIPVYIVYDSETIQQRLASGPVLSKPRLSINNFMRNIQN